MFLVVKRQIGNNNIGGYEVVEQEELTLDALAELSSYYKPTQVLGNLLVSEDGKDVIEIVEHPAQHDVEYRDGMTIRYIKQGVDTVTPTSIMLADMTEVHILPKDNFIAEVEKIGGEQ